MSDSTNLVSEQISKNDAKGIPLNSFFGIKAGMTRIFNEDGTHIPVTVVKLIPNVISQVKTKEKDGYEAYQIAYGQKREKLVNKPTAAHLKKANLSPVFTRFSELKVENVGVDNLGKEVSVELFKPSTQIDVTGISKGKGFQGVMKRYNFRGGPAAHGSCFHRAPGSIGNRATPARVFKNKKLPGHMGDRKVTVQNLSVVDVKIDKGYILLRGSVPGSINSFIKVSLARKSAI